jgi:muramoyltetrapeptide carboxypeptidase LdcA involved in peptidoglycan recycling
MTVLHYALLKRAGLATFYGPALTLEPAEYPAVFPYTDRWLRAAWFRTESLVFEAANGWTEEFLDFNDQVDLTRAREMTPSEGWVTIAPGRAEGVVIGGCLETICWHLRGQADWIQPDGDLFFFETSEEAPSPAHVDGYLTDLEQLGVFDACTGVLVGRPRGYTSEDRSTLWEIVAGCASRAGVPALGNIDCSHTDPMLTLPLVAPPSGRGCVQTCCCPLVGIS